MTFMPANDNDVQIYETEVFKIKIMKSRHISLTLAFLTLGFIMACKKSVVYENPYDGGKEPLGVSLSLVTAPEPQEAAGGATVTFAATGLLPYKDLVVFSFNGQRAEILSITAAGITVKVPEDASTGIATLSVNDQVFFGPKFKVSGKISIDPEFRVSGGANRDIFAYYPLTDDRFIFVGAFTDYDGKGIIFPVNRIVRAFKNGNADISFRSSGADGSIFGIVPLGDKYITAGSFSGFYFNSGRSILTNIHNITQLGASGEVDSILVDTYSTNHSIGPGIPATGKKKAVPAFNGGTNSTIGKIYSYQNKLTATGNFKYYISKRYDLSRKPVVISGITLFGDSIVTDSVETPQIVRFNADGSLDKTFRFNSTNNRGLSAGNGFVSSSYMQADGRLIVVGSFNKFDELTAGRIVRLNVNGTVDPSFNSGTGADRGIGSITYNPLNKKYLITGSFTTYNGVSAKGIALLNEDGSIDQSFVSKGFSSDGGATFAKQLSNGMIVVSGVFSSYNEVRRSGFMILTPGGDLAKGYNAIGGVKGYVNDLYETTNSTGQMAVMLVGSFTQIDGTTANNITRLIFEK